MLVPFMSCRRCCVQPGTGAIAPPAWFMHTHTRTRAHAHTRTPAHAHTHTRTYIHTRTAEQDPPTHSSSGTPARPARPQAARARGRLPAHAHAHAHAHVRTHAPGADSVTPTAPSAVGPRLLHVYCCPPARSSRRLWPAAASAGETYAPTLRMADDVPPGAPTVPSAGPGAGRAGGVRGGGGGARGGGGRPPPRGGPRPQRSLAHTAAGEVSERTHAPADTRTHAHTRTHTHTHAHTHTQQRTHQRCPPTTQR
jgi:hypothetical protein